MTNSLEYLRTDEFEEVFQGLNFIADILPLVREHPHYWKWIIISAHSALQGACVCMLTETAGTGALRKDATTKLLARLDEDAGSTNEWPDERLADLSELLARLPVDLKIKIKELATPFPFDVVGDIRRLHDMRNEFSHFTPKSWSIELAGLPRILEHTIGLIEEIAKSANYKRWNRFLDLPISQVADRIRSQLGNP